MSLVSPLESVLLKSDMDILLEVTVQGKNIPISTGSAAIAAIDTGTTLIGGPTADVQAIYNAIPGSQAVPNSGGLYAFRKYLFFRALKIIQQCVSSLQHESKCIHVLRREFMGHKP